MPKSKQPLPSNNNHQPSSIETGVGNLYATPEDNGNGPIPAIVRDGQDGQVGRVLQGYGKGVVGETAAFLSRFIVMPQNVTYTVATWIAAAWLSEVWDRFPHLAINSPEKRCGKTHLLQLIELLTPNPINTTSISPASVYRLIEACKPTLLLDEAQSLSRRGSESSEVLREILCAGIDRNAKVIRCDTSTEGGKSFTPTGFKVYCPKAIALIGNLDNALADRCLPITLNRKTEQEKVEQYRSRIVEPIGEEIKKRLETWAKRHKAKVIEMYDKIEPIHIQNDRMAELLMPLQAVLTVADKVRLPILEEYAKLLDEKDREAERQSIGIRLLVACKEIFTIPNTKEYQQFLTTDLLLLNLKQRVHEEWNTCSRRGPITPETLARLLRPYEIKPCHSPDKKIRGYYARSFEQAWLRYTPL